MRFDKRRGEIQLGFEHRNVIAVLDNQQVATHLFKHFGGIGQEGWLTIKLETYSRPKGVTMRLADVAKNGY